MSSAGQPELSIVVPGYNEAENFEILIPKLKSALVGLRAELIIVDNASTDKTREVLERFRKDIPFLTIVSEPMLGYGRAVLKGFAASHGEYISVIRSDNQEKPEDLVRMYTQMRSGGYGFCKAIRKARDNDGTKRVIISAFFNSLFKVFFDLRSRDINATPKLFTRDFYRTANLKSLDWFIDAEMVIRAERRGLKILEVEIDYLPRLKGKSTVRMTTIFQFLRNMLIWRFFEKL